MDHRLRQGKGKPDTTAPWIKKIKGMYIILMVVIFFKSLFINSHYSRAISKNGLKGVTVRS
jgi:uncharacterized membrane protein YcfT